MSTHNIHFHDKMIKFLKYVNVYFLELSEEFPRDFKTSSYQPW